MTNSSVLATSRELSLRLASVTESAPCREGGIVGQQTCLLAVSAMVYDMQDWRACPIHFQIDKIYCRQLSESAP
eukprot:2470287-Pyramimonas_sp.AAC.1